MNRVRVGVAFSADVFTQVRYSIALSSIDILLFPELLDGGYAALKQGATPHLPNDRFLLTLRQASQKLSCAIAAGSNCIP